MPSSGPWNPESFSISSGSGTRPSTRSKARTSWARRSGPASDSMRRARASASSCTSDPFMSERAWSGVVVRLRLGQDSLKPGASKAAIIGRGSDRRWKM